MRRELESTAEANCIIPLQYLIGIIINTRVCRENVKRNCGWSIFKVGLSRFSYDIVRGHIT